MPGENVFDTMKAGESLFTGALDPYNILAGIVFGVIGMGALSYGKKLERWKPIVIGLILMIYPYFIYNKYLLWFIGTGLVVTLWFHHDE